VNLAPQTEADKTVFISYAREDSPEAERLYRDLKNAGAKPWIDKEEIRAGENWDLALSKAIKNNRYFIPLFSSKSVDKIGYVNKELRYALDALDNYPEKTIFMIPVRLDDCEIPFEKLKKIQNADLFPDWNDGIKRIFKSMGIDIVESEQKEDQGGDERWKMGISEYHWNRLLKNIYDKKCIAFIGPGIYKVPNKDGRPLIPLSIVDKLKEKYCPPLEDLYQLARIYTLENSGQLQLARLTQFLAIEDAEGNEIDPKTLLSEMINEIDSSKFSFPSETRLPYDILADLDLPIYVTTNYDHFLEDALARSKRLRKQPQSDFFRWSEELIEYSKLTDASSIFDDSQYKPTEERPLVYHIHGDIKNPWSMVLTEKDYFDFVIKTNKEEAQDIPPVLRREIATSSLLFVGYSVEDIDFRTIFQGFLTFLEIKKREPSVAVQLPPQFSKKAKAKMQRYLEQYTRNLYPNVYQFWGDTSDFITELDERWREFKQEK
jgi:SIR2-like domain/TIR domain